MKENKKFRKDDLSSVDSSKRVYRMYKKKKNWVVAPVLFALLAPTMIAGPVSVLAENAPEVKTGAPETNDKELAEKIENANVIMEGMVELNDSENQKEVEDYARRSIETMKHDVRTAKTLDEFETAMVSIYNANFKAIQVGHKNTYQHTLDKYLDIKDTKPYVDLQKEINKINTVAKYKAPITATTVDIEKKIQDYRDDLADYVSDVNDKIADADEAMTLYTDIDTHKQNVKNQIQEWANEVSGLHTDVDHAYFETQVEASLAIIDSQRLSNDPDKKEFDTVYKAIQTEKDNVEKDYYRVLIDAQAKEFTDELDRNDVSKNNDVYKQITNWQDDLKTDDKDKLKDIHKYITSAEFAQRVQDAINGEDEIGNKEKQKLRAEIDTFVDETRNGKGLNLEDADLEALEADAISLKEKINAATTTKELDKVRYEFETVKAHYQALDKNKSLETVKKNAIKKINEDKKEAPLKFLSQERIGETIRLIQDYATTKEEVASYVKDLYTEATAEKDAIEDARKDAKQAIRDLKLNSKSAFKDETGKFWPNAKTTPITEKNLLTLIDKENLLKEDLDKIVRDANFAKERELAYENVSELPQINVTKDGSELATATNTDKLKRAVSNIVTKEFGPKVKATQNESKKRGLALQGVDKLPYLTNDQKEKATKDLNDADTADKVQRVWEAAVKLNDANKDNSSTNQDLQDAKDMAIDHINSLEYLDSSLKEAFISEVNDANTIKDIFGKTTATNPGSAAKNSILYRANEENKHQKGLVDAKNAASKEINNLPQLSVAEKNDFKKAINESTSEAGINTILRNAKDLNDIRQIEKAEDKDAAKKLAKDKVGALDLNKDQKDGYKRRIDKADSVEEIADIYKEAVKAANKGADEKLIPQIDKAIKAGQYVVAQQLIDQLLNEDTRDKYQDKLDEAKEVAAAKAEAKKVIDSLSSIDDKEKAEAKKDLDKLTTVKDIDNFVEKLLVTEDKLLAEAIEALIKAEKFEEAQAKIDQLRSQTEKDRLTAMLEEAMNVLPRLQYTAHVRNKGWMKVGNIKPTDEKVATIGTTGEALPMEAIVVSLNDVNLKKNGIQYRAHVRNIGWQEWTNSGYVAGTTGKALSIESLQFKLTGDVAKKYDIEYRAHVRNLGWQKWVKNGAKSGTTGKALPIEALQIKLVKKDVAK